MKKLYLAILSIGIAGVVACASPTPPPTPTPSVPSPAKAKMASTVIAEGRVVPLRSAALAFPIGGIVAEVPVALGAGVKAGDLLARLDTRQLELQLAQAEANLAAAQAKLNQVKTAPKPEDLAAAQQNLASAQAAYDGLTKPSPSELAALKADVDKTRALLDQAQAAYDRVGGDGNENAGALPQRAQLQVAWLDHQKALAVYESKTKPSNAQLQGALAALQTAKTQLAKLQPTADDVAAAEANVNAARAARDLAAEQVKHARITAPFAGTVTSLDARVGEYVAPGTSLLRLADVSAWQIETTDLTELNIVDVQVGDSVSLSFDAIPGLQTSGKVSQIKAYGENRQGDIVYTVIVTPDQMDTRWRWNMTAKVSIEPAK